MAEPTTTVENIWVDIETTGLDPKNDVILELGLMLTNKWGDEIAHFSWLVGNNSNFYHNSVERGKQNEYVGPMHEKSGLWSDWDAGPRASVSEVETIALDFLDQYDVKYFTLPMCGSSVQFDRNFLFHYMPSLHDHFHYRNIDVSTVKELCRRLNKPVFNALDAATQKQGKHRVIPDLQDTISEYQYYVDNFLWVAE